MNNLRSLTLLDGFIRNQVVNEGLGHIISLRFLLESFDISYVLYLERVPMIRRACVVLLACFSEWGVPYWSAACCRFLRHRPAKVNLSHRIQARLQATVGIVVFVVSSARLGPTCLP